jgi:hypothetical protein
LKFRTSAIALYMPRTTVCSRTFLALARGRFRPAVHSRSGVSSTSPLPTVLQTTTRCSQSREAVLSGFQSLVSYSYGKCQDNVFPNTRPDPGYLNSYAECDYDLRHVLAISGLYELPFGCGRMFLSHMNAPLDAVLGGWEFAAIFTARSGLPYQRTHKMITSRSKCLPANSSSTLFNLPIRQTSHHQGLL